MTDTISESDGGWRFSTFRFTLRTLFVLTTIASIGIALKVDAVRRQRAAIGKLTTLQVAVHYDYQHAALPPDQLAWSGSPVASLAFPNQPAMHPNGPRWLRQMIGDDYFQDVTAVTLFTNDLLEIQAALPHLKQLPYLQELLLYSPSCGMGIPDYVRAKELLERELPNVTITDIGSIPIVG